MKGFKKKTLIEKSLKWEKEKVYVVDIYKVQHTLSL